MSEQEFINGVLALLLIGGIFGIMYLFIEHGDKFFKDDEDWWR